MTPFGASPADNEAFHARVLRETGIDAATLDLLSVLRRSGPPYTLSTRELARRTLVTAGAVSQRVARAEQDGLVRRTPGATGRRTALVEPTAAGHALVEQSVDQVLGQEATLVEGLTEDERATLIALLGKLMADVRTRTDRSRKGGTSGPVRPRDPLTNRRTPAPPPRTYPPRDQGRTAAPPHRNSLDPGWPPRA